LLLSRIENEVFRHSVVLPEGKDDWKVQMSTGPQDEAKLKQELDWLSSHNQLREYMLVAVRKPIKALEDGDLDDDIPW
jgi:hypothetical protein